MSYLWSLGVTLSYLHTHTHTQPAFMLIRSFFKFIYLFPKNSLWNPITALELLLVTLKYYYYSLLKISKNGNANSIGFISFSCSVWWDSVIFRKVIFCAGLIVFGAAVWGGRRSEQLDAAAGLSDKQDQTDSLNDIRVHLLLD